MEKLKAVATMSAWTNLLPVGQLASQTYTQSAGSPPTKLANHRSVPAVDAGFTGK